MRHVTYTPEKGAEIIALLESGAFIETAAAACGISKVTLFAWLRRGRRGETPELAEFSDKVRRGMAASEIEDLNVIKKAARDGQWTASAWRLERKYPDRYGKRGDEALIEMKVEKRLKELLAKARKNEPPPKLKAVR